MICEKEWAKATGGRYLGTCVCEKCMSQETLLRQVERLKKEKLRRRRKKDKARKSRDMYREQVKIALDTVLNKGFDANDVMVLLMAFHHSIHSWDSWEWVETLIEEVVGEKPEWHECKKLLRQINTQRKKQEDDDEN